MVQIFTKNLSKIRSDLDLSQMEIKNLTENIATKVDYLIIKFFENL